MKLRNTIFDSSSETEVFRSLQSRWSSKLTLYPLLPFSKIVQIDPQELTPQERDYFYKTNVDYTFCQESGRPLLSIEFDGIGGGFSRDGIYVAVRQTLEDPYRKLKMDFKLRLAKQVGYPLVVVSFEETRLLDKEDSLTILDGIVGQLLAEKRSLELLNKVVKESGAQIDENDVISAGVAAELEEDPIAKKASDYSFACYQHGISFYKVEFLNDPPLPECKGFVDNIEKIEARFKAAKNATRVGCRIIIKTPKVDIIRTVWVRNFEGNPVTIAKNITEYLAFKKAHSLFVKR